MTETPSPMCPNCERLQQQIAMLKSRNAWLEKSTMEQEDDARAETAEAALRRVEQEREGYRARVEQLEQALQAAQQFLTPGIDRGPAINGWQNTVDTVEAALASPAEATAQRCDHKLVESNRCLKCGQVLACYGLTD
jgi:LPS O-antigen subunit length determinant protein (WzzB/FepE family)